MEDPMTRLVPCLIAALMLPAAARATVTAYATRAEWEFEAGDPEVEDFETTPPSKEPVSTVG
jgi:hypothetical protein